MIIEWIILFSLLGSIGAIITAAIFLLFPERVQKVLIPCLISYATGILLAAALLGLIPHALSNTSSQNILFTVLIGIILFFLLEKLMIWRHCHEKECEVHKVTAPMILLGDFFHNLTDGFVIAASFLSSFPVGVVAGLSIIAHEIPQEVGDFGILLHSGYKRRKALLLNTLSGLSTIPGAILAYYALELIQAAVPYVMAISASSFLYIALADLTPELHRSIRLWDAVRQIVLLLAGVMTITLILQFHP
ncbi:ZIP zinc transporter [miscellaneous Crenarchaeota group archaeon SMTZ-80]|nr:MAG: ZIP zinc transporter [miscellaneous Crenarchaeota group archaeon SMTZ-80]